MSLVITVVILSCFEIAMELLIRDSVPAAMSAVEARMNNRYSHASTERLFITD